MTTFFADYQWSRDRRERISPIDDRAGEQQIRLLDVDGAVPAVKQQESGEVLDASLRAADGSLVTCRCGLDGAFVQRRTVSMNANW